MASCPSVSTVACSSNGGAGQGESEIFAGRSAHGGSHRVGAKVVPSKTLEVAVRVATLVVASLRVARGVGSTRSEEHVHVSACLPTSLRSATGARRRAHLVRELGSGRLDGLTLASVGRDTSIWVTKLSTGG